MRMGMGVGVVEMELRRRCAMDGGGVAVFVVLVVVGGGATAGATAGGEDLVVVVDVLGSRGGVVGGRDDGWLWGVTVDKVSVLDVLGAASSTWLGVALDSEEVAE